MSPQNIYRYCILELSEAAGIENINRLNITRWNTPCNEQHFTVILIIVHNDLNSCEVHVIDVVSGTGVGAYVRLQLSPGDNIYLK